MIYTTYYSSPIGKIMTASGGESIVGLWFEGQKYYGGIIKEEMVVKDDLPIFQKLKKWLDRYFNGKKPDIYELPLEPAGSDFQKEVWKILCQIPYGKCMTYGDIAKQIAAKMGKKNISAQAVGGAVGRNPISIIIPCHRVIGANGNLTGYAGGIDKKIALLKNEGFDVERLHDAVRK